MCSNRSKRSTLSNHRTKILIASLFGWHLLLVGAVEAEVAQPQPQAQVAIDFLEFGRIGSGDPLSTVFAVSNDGDADLILEEVRVSTRWLTVDAPDSVAPQSMTQITVALDTSQLSGPFEGEVILTTNDPLNRSLSLRLQGYVGPEVEVNPRPLIALRAFTWEAASAKSSVTLVNRTEGPLEIGEISGEGESFTTEILPIVVGQEYQLTVRLKPGSSFNMERSQLSIETNKGAVPILVLTLLKPRVYVLPQSLEFVNIDRAELESRPETSESLEEVFHVYRLGGEDLAIEAESSLSFISVTKKPIEGPGIIVDIPGQGPTAVFDLTVVPMSENLPLGPFKGSIRIQTDDPEFPEFEVPVSGIVE